MDDREGIQRIQYKLKRAATLQWAATNLSLMLYIFTNTARNLIYISYNPVVLSTFLQGTCNACIDNIE